MKYLNLSSSTNSALEYMAATRDQRAIWFDLICYCHIKMNGGVINDLARWPEEMCQRVIGASKQELRDHSPLWNWTDDALTVHLYDTKEEQVQLNRIAKGAEYSERRWRAKKEKKIIAMKNVKQSSQNG